MRTLVIFVACLISGLIILAFGYWLGMRDSVYEDYKMCADNMHDRDIANNDAKPGSPVPFNEECAKHADSVYGSSRWQNILKIKTNIK